MSRTKKKRHRNRRRCRSCGCTEANCTECYKLTGSPCWWIGPRLCSACATPALRQARYQLRFDTARRHRAQQKGVGGVA